VPDRDRFFIPLSGSLQISPPARGKAARSLLRGGPSCLSATPRQAGSGIALKNGVRGVVAAPGGFRPASHSGRLSAGWRRAYRLSGRTLELTLSDSAREGENPLDRGDKSAIVKSVDANVPPDQPPSTVDSPSRVPRLGLSATGIAFDTYLDIPSAQFSAASPGCGVTPSGLTY
jgi:hypothetical protein